MSTASIPGTLLLRRTAQASRKAAPRVFLALEFMTDGVQAQARNVLGSKSYGDGSVKQITIDRDQLK